MADKSISELTAANQVTPTDLFVLEQSGTAKKLTGQILENWLTSFADGHGGIQSIVKKSTSGLVDTYRITLADTTTFDFVVTNGKGVSSITKTGTSGLVDTYRINFNDNSSSTFTVTNGAKGDKGDNQYVWIKYASQQPTSSSHSFGDVADNWIGIYSGASATAPTSWNQYTWFEIKGKKGDTGVAATLTRTAVEYQASDSGVIIPSSAWSSSVPVVAQGKYLWTRTTNTFNTGSPAVSYSVSRMGLDGTGSVSTVAGISPGSDGNVSLKAQNVGALPSSGGTMTGTLDMNGQKLTGLSVPTTDTEAATKGYVDAIDWFGTGAAIESNEDLNADKYTNFGTSENFGKYYCPNGTTAKTLVNCPTQANFTMFTLARTKGKSINQLLLTSNAIFMRGSGSDGVWTDWEKFTQEGDISLAMNPGVEYKTLERYGGEAVYAKRVSQTFTSQIGNDNGSTDIAILHGIANFKECVRWTGSDGSYTYPYFNNVGGIITVKSVDATNINIRCLNADRPATAESPITLSFIVYYTKT